MTIMVAAQATPNASPDPIDLLVPRPRPRLRMALIGLVVIVVLSGVGYVDSIGAITPRLGVGGAGNVMWTEAYGHIGPRLSFIVRNNGPYQVVITGIDDHVAGLGDSSYLFTRTSSANGPTTSSWGGEAPLRAHSSIEVTLRYGGYDCQRINAGGVSAIPIKLSNIFGMSRNVSVVPIEFYPANGDNPIGIDNNTQSYIGWPQALTWTACHRGSAIPAASFGSEN